MKAQSTNKSILYVVDKFIIGIDSRLRYEELAIT